MQRCIRVEAFIAVAHFIFSILEGCLLPSDGKLEPPTLVQCWVLSLPFYVGHRLDYRGVFISSLNVTYDHSSHYQHPYKRDPLTPTTISLMRCIFV